MLKIIEFVTQSSSCSQSILNFCHKRTVQNHLLLREMHCNNGNNYLKPELIKNWSADFKS